MIELVRLKRGPKVLVARVNACMDAIDEFRGKTPGPGLARTADGTIYQQRIRREQRGGGGGSSSPYTSNASDPLELCEVYDSNVPYRPGEHVCWRSSETGEYYKVYERTDLVADSGIVAEGNGSWTLITDEGANGETPAEVYNPASTYESGVVVRFGTAYRLYLYTSNDAIVEGESPTSAPAKWDKGAVVGYGIAVWPPPAIESPFAATKVPYKTLVEINHRYSELYHTLTIYLSEFTYDDTGRIAAQGAITKHVEAQTVEDVDV